LQAELEQYVPSLLRPVLSLDEWFDPGGFEVGEQGRRAVELLQDLARPSAGAWSKALGCTRHALRRLCQREFGLPTEEVVWLWVAHCVLEVRRQGATLAEAAELFGYSNAGSLHRAFSRRGIPVPSRGSVAQRAAG
jgi:AraC-like DNA-binding protein